MNTDKRRYFYSGFVCFWLYYLNLCQPKKRSVAFIFSGFALLLNVVSKAVAGKVLIDA